MIVNTAHDPLIALPPPEVPLPAAPLVRVIAQLRFPAILSVEKREFIAPFQEAIRKTYPVLRAEQTQGFVLGPQGLSPAPTERVWRFNDVDGMWRVSLAPEFVALETTNYSSRDDFLKRFAATVQALQQHFDPKTMDRIGVRYIDRVTGLAFSEIRRLVRPEVLGVLGSPAARHARHTLSESLFEVPGVGAELQARWGTMPVGGSMDPAAIEPIDEPSWILDLDMFRKASVPFDPEQVLDDTRTFTERLYTFFRWAVTSDFLAHYGGKV